MESLQESIYISWLKDLDKVNEIIKCHNLLSDIINKCEKIKHYVYKSDVFSLGLCILLGATLNYDSLCQIRELTDMNEIQNVLMYYLSGRYSNSFIFFLLKLLEVDESKRPDFIQLENMLVKRQ